MKRKLTGFYFDLHRRKETGSKGTISLRGRLISLKYDRGFNPLSGNRFLGAFLHRGYIFDTPIFPIFDL